MHRGLGVEGLRVASVRKGGLVPLVGVAGPLARQGGGLRQRQRAALKVVRVLQLLEALLGCRVAELLGVLDVAEVGWVRGCLVG